MQNMPDFSEILRLAQTPEGKKLIELLQHTDSNTLSAALSSARSGDYNAAKNALSGLLSSPDVQELLNSMGGGHG